MSMQHSRTWRTTAGMALGSAILVASSSGRCLAQGAETLKALGAYRLTVPTLTKVLEAGQAIEKSPDAKPIGEATAELTRMSIEQVMAVTDKYPSMKRAVASSGLSNREFSTALLSLTWATRYLAEEEMMKGMGKTPPGPPAHVPKANVDLVRRNRALIEKYQ